MGLRTRLDGWLSGRRPGRAGEWLLARPRMLAWGLSGLSLAAWVGFLGALWFAWDIR